MANNVKVSFGTSTAITITLASLATSAVGVGREATAVDNTTNLFLDAFVTVKIKTNGSGPTGDKAVYVYAAFSEDGTIWPDTVTGSDAGITLTQPTNLVLLGAINAVAASTTYIRTFPMSSAWGGLLSRKWSIVVVNATGNVFDSTSGNFLVQYSGVFETVG